MNSSLAIIHFFFLSLFFPIAHPFSFNFSGKARRIDDCPRGINTVCLQGDASITNEGTLYLTVNQIDRALNSSVGRAVLSEPVRLYDNSTGELASFSSEFSFSINNFGNQNYADGLAFFLGHYPSSIPPNSTGRCLGLMTDSINKTDIPHVSSPNESFVAVEFDSFKNFFDFSSRHVGIDVNTILSRAYFNLSIHFDRNYTGKANITYVGAKQNLSISVEYAGARYHMAHKLPLREVLPEWVSVGFSATTGERFELHKIYSWKFNSTLDADFPTSIPVEGKAETSNNKKVWLVVGILVCVGLMIGVASFILVRRRKKRGGGNMSSDEVDDNDPAIDEEFENGGGPRRIPYKELYAATQGFNEERQLGSGGFGAVYRGCLSDGTEVAIKASKDPTRGRKEYTTEVKVISQLRHRNLVHLVGWCHSRGEFLLVYEFMPNGSLDLHLFGEQRPTLPWPRRQEIALGLASALFYLHEECRQCVLHRDLKSSNVMLDSDFKAKLGDFGLARFVDHGMGLHTTGLAGTRSYMAPECFFTGKASKQSDVYSLGIVLLEIACGRRPMEDDMEETLVERVWRFRGSGSLLQAMDPRLEGAFDEEQAELMLLVGLWCSHPDPNMRPAVSRVAPVLNREASSPAVPLAMPKPVYSAQTSKMGANLTSTSSPSGSTSYSTMGTGTSVSREGRSSGLGDCSPSTYSSDGRYVTATAD